MERQNSNPWLHLWTEPRKTMRAILDKNPKRLVILLAILGGIFSAFAFAAISWYPPKSPLFYLFLVLALVVMGAILGVIHLYFSGWLLSLTGSWLGGKGLFTDVKCAVGWSNYPFIVANLFAILMAITSQNIWIKTIFSLLNLTAVIWGFIIFLKLLGEAHRFSAWKALLALLIASVLVFVVIIIIALIIPLIAPLF